MKRNPWLRIATTASAMVIVLLLATSFRFLQSRGVFTSLTPVSPGLCRAIAVAGAGDIAVDRVGKTAFVAVAGRTPSVLDGIYTYSYDQPGAKLVKLGGTPKDFHPRAIALVRASDNSLLLRAIFPREGSSFSIAAFKVKPGALEELGRISADILVDPSDLVSLDQDRFYILNRHTTRTALGRWLDDSFLLPRATVLFFDGMKFVTVAEQLNTPSGIALSPDGSRLYIAETYPRSLVSFERNMFTGGLENPTLLSIPSGLQKIGMTQDGSLIIAAQPKLFAASTFARDQAEPAASQVYQVNVQNGVPQTASLVYADKGREIGAASAAVQAGNHLLIGSVLDNKLLDCTAR